MRPLHRLLAVSLLSLPLIAAGALPAFAGDRDNGNHYGQEKNGPRGNDNHYGQGQNGATAGAPEIDPGLLGAVVTLVAGGLLILRERRRG
jgi:hypothetical protein